MIFIFLKEDGKNFSLKIILKEIEGKKGFWEKGLEIGLPLEGFYEFKSKLSLKTFIYKKNGWSLEPFLPFEKSFFKGLFTQTFYYLVI